MLLAPICTFKMHSQHGSDLTFIYISINPLIDVFHHNTQCIEKTWIDGYGGVLIAVRDIINTEELPIQYDTKSSYVRVTTPHNKSITVRCLYRPFNSEITYLDNMC